MQGMEPLSIDDRQMVELMARPSFAPILCLVLHRLLGYIFDTNHTIETYLCI
jgi:hypothetical protein